MEPATISHPNLQVEAEFDPVEEDALSGRIVAILEEAGVADNTLVFFIPDNGSQNDSLPDGGHIKR